MAEKAKGNGASTGRKSGQSSILTVLEEEGNRFVFRVAGIDRSVVNALRRIILSRIPCVVLRTEPHAASLCTVVVNTTQFHNEILKHRLSCVPVHTTDLDTLPGKCELEIDEHNTTAETTWVTTEHFRIRDVATGTYWTPDKSRVLFPPDPKTLHFIDFVRLRGGEALKLRCGFVVSSADENQAFNVVSKCAVTDTLDPHLAEQAFLRQQQQQQQQQPSKEKHDFDRRNFFLLDALRYTIPGSFDFVVESVGVFPPRTLLQKACALMQNECVDVMENELPIVHVDGTMANAFDVLLPDEDATLGYVLQSFVMDLAYEEGQEQKEGDEGEGDEGKRKPLHYVGFAKLHPNDQDSRLRVAYRAARVANKAHVAQVVKEAMRGAEHVFRELYHAFA